MARVITEFGFGEEIDIVEKNGMSIVRLDHPFQGKIEMALDRKRNVFDFNDHALFRVVNMEHLGTFSNLLFMSKVAAVERVHERSPQNEARFYLNLETGVFEAGHTTEGFLMAFPFVDTWGVEISLQEEIGSRKEALRLWRESKQHLAGSTHLSAGLLLDLDQKRIMSFFLATLPPMGIFYAKDFPVH